MSVANADHGLQAAIARSIWNSCSLWDASLSSWWSLSLVESRAFAVATDMLPKIAFHVRDNNLIDKHFQTHSFFLPETTAPYGTSVSRMPVNMGRQHGFMMDPHAGKLKVNIIGIQTWRMIHVSSSNYEWLQGVSNMMLFFSTRWNPQWYLDRVWCKSPNI